MSSRSATTSKDFVIPRGSRTVRILSPDAQPETAILSRSFKPEPIPSPGNSDLRNSATPAEEKQMDSLESDESLEEIRFKPRRTRSDDVKNENDASLDVYAGPYIPLALRILNELPADVNTTRIHAAINFEAYTKTFVGSDFLLAFPKSIPRHENILNLDASQVDKLDPIIAQDDLSSQYTLYFECLLAIEVMKHRDEYKSYNKYDIAPMQHNKHNHLVFKIHGLREDTPFIRRGDIISLRPLSYQDSAARLRTMDHWLRQINLRDINPALSLRELADFIVQRRDDPAPGYCAVQWNCSIFNVDRKTERVVLDQLPLSPDQHFNIIFPVKESHYRNMLQVISLLGAYMPSSGAIAENEKLGRSWVESMLFPSIDDGVEQKVLDPASKTTRIWFDNSLNHEQKKSVSSLCSMNYGNVPFLISGPPGTGKTKTLVETVLQLIRNMKRINHILVCTPSDPSADILANRLSSHLSNEELLRLNSPSRTVAEVPTKLHKYCKLDGDTFVLPEFRKLMRYRVIVTTCLDSSILLNARLTNSDLFDIEHGLISSLHPSADLSPIHLHWNALLIDEAGQATEPMAAIPLAVVAPPKTDAPISGKPLFAMAGDEHQLGPRTYSLHPKLMKSLFARLFAQPLYADHPLARGTMFTRAILPMIRPAFVNLISNYRSHPAILAVPSYLFYADSLMDKALDGKELLDLPIWQGNKWPVLFSPNYGMDERELEGTGWYNDSEIEIALAYSIQILETKMIQQNEITVMSPFAKQVRLLRERFQKHQLWSVNIGPCEAFQGLENRVIILCTTRARKKYLKRDIALCRGVVNQSNRMNVCLTRAKQGLVVIGHPELLSEDPHWVEFLGFCARNGLHDSKELTIDRPTPKSLPRMERVLLGQKAQQEDPVGVEKLLGAGNTSEGDEMWQTIYTNTEGDSIEVEAESDNVREHVVPVYGPAAFPQYITSTQRDQMQWPKSDLQSQLDEIHERSLIPKELLN